MWTPEKRAELASKLRGKKRTEATKQRMREIALARPKVSEETKAKLSRAATARWQRYHQLLALEAAGKVEIAQTEPTAAKVTTPKPKCTLCNGTKRVAGDSQGKPLEDQTSWDDFLSLGPAITDAVIQAGLMKPVACPACT